MSSDSERVLKHKCVDLETPDVKLALPPKPLNSEVLVSQQGVAAQDTYSHAWPKLGLRCMDDRDPSKPLYTLTPKTARLQIRKLGLRGV